MCRPLTLLLLAWMLLTFAGMANATSKATIAEIMKGADGTAVVLDMSTNRVVGSYRLQEAAMLRSAPGSTLKPLLLLDLLQDGRVNAKTTWSCPRVLWVNGNRVSCAHPSSESIFDAQEALVWSCNSYFAHAALLYREGELERVLVRAGLTSATGLAHVESLGQITAAHNPEQRQLLALGVAGIQVTALELLQAYRRLALGLTSAHASSADGIVQSALKETVERGMARSASVTGVKVAGKTGTAADPGHSAGHGWFVGYAPADHPSIAVVVRLENAHGMDAAHVGGKILATYVRAPR